MKMKNKNDLTVIPGIGHNLAHHLFDIGIKVVSDLKGKDPEKLFQKLCSKRGEKVDRCVLYVFRCAVYYANHTRHDPKKLKWWEWKDK